MTSLNCFNRAALSVGAVVALLAGVGTTTAAESARVFDATRHALFNGAVVTGATGPKGSSKADSATNPFAPGTQPGRAPLIDDFSRGAASPGRVLPPPAIAASNQADVTPRLPGPDHPALDAEIQRLREIAFRPPGAAGHRAKPAQLKRAGATRANQAQARASWLMGLLTLHGIGVAADSADAVSWFEQARLLGEPMANAGLAWCDIDGCKTAPNPALARRWLPALRAVNLPRAQYLQWLIDSRLQPLQSEAPSARSDPNRPGTATLASRPLLVGAAKRGDIQANLELGLTSAANNQLAEALVFFRAAASRSNAAADNADWVLQRLAAASNPDASVSPSSINPSILPGRDRAATKPGTSGMVMTPGGMSSPAETLARAKRNHRGEGQSANYTEAIRLYRLAQNQGNSASSIEARKILELIFSRPGPGGQLDVAWMQQLAYVDLSGRVASLDRATMQNGLRREQTPLFDLLPQRWRNEAVHGLPAQPRVR